MINPLGAEPWLEKKRKNFPEGFISPPESSEIGGPGKRVKDAETSLITQVSPVCLVLGLYNAWWLDCNTPTPYPSPATFPVSQRVCKGSFEGQVIFKGLLMDVSNDV